MKTMNKEKFNNFVIPLPALCLLIVPYFSLMPKHPCQKRKKGWTHFECSQMTNYGFHTSQHTDLDWTFGMVMINLIVHMWHLWITFLIRTLSCIPMMSYLGSNNSNTTLMSLVPPCLSSAPCYSYSLDSYLGSTSTLSIRIWSIVLQNSWLQRSSMTTLSRKDITTTWKSSSGTIACEATNDGNSHPPPGTHTTPEFLDLIAPWDQPHTAYSWMMMSVMTSMTLTLCNKPSSPA